MNPNDFHPSAPGRLVKTSQGYWAFCGDPLPPELAWTGALVTLHSEAERELARLALYAKMVETFGGFKELKLGNS